MPVMKEIKTPFLLFKVRYFQDEKGIYYKKIGEHHRKTVRPFWKLKRIVWGIPVIILLVLGGVGYRIGMNLVSDKMVDELASQITKEDYNKLLKDPSVQQIIEKEMGSDKKSELLNSISSDPAIKDTVNNGQAIPVSATTTENTNNEKQPATTIADSGKDKDKNVAAVTPDKGKTEEQKPSVEQEKPQPGLHFNSRSEAMKFLLSKFSMSELSAFAKKAEGGVTPEEKAEIKSAVLGRLSAEEYNALKVFALVEASKR
ncbi:hypothetical protein [Neobacillus drentensis]|uniref:hypothetical protein n=1 Tax=Neobacillus drentensis TaxID=220684 RepID=UPI002FFF441A